MTFDPRVQIRATFALSSTLQVSVSPYELKESLKVGFALSRQWRRMASDNHFAAVVRLQFVAETQSDVRVVFAEVVMEQISEITGYEGDALTEVLEVTLCDMLLPYARAQLAALLLPTGYHYLTLPPQLTGTSPRATEVFQVAAAETAVVPHSADAAAEALVTPQKELEELAS